MTKTMLLVVCLSARIASAEAPSDPARSPGFWILERYDGDSRLGLEGTVAPVDSGIEKGQLAGRFDLHAHYVDPTYNVGGYVQMQRWVYGGDDLEPGSANGAPELGAIYVARLDEHVALVPRVGVVLPTLSRMYRAPVLVGARPSEIYQHDDSMFVRAGVSPLVRYGRLFARADIEGAADTTGESRITYGINVNVGVGFELGRVAVMAELATLTAHDNGSEGNGSDIRGRPASTEIYGAPAISVRAQFAHVQTYAAVAAPIVDRMGWVATAGIDLSLDAY